MIYKISLNPVVSYFEFFSLRHYAYLRDLCVEIAH
jgi:hypothetical protein